MSRLRISYDLPLVIALCTYLFSMFIYPFFLGNMSIKFLINTLHDWQSFNAGIIALITAIYVFKVTKITEDVRKSYNHKAYLPFLSSSVHEIEKFSKSALEVLMCIGHKSKYFMQLDIRKNPTDKIKSDFRDAIVTAPSEIAKSLCEYMEDIQELAVFIEKIETERIKYLHHIPVSAANIDYYTTIANRILENSKSINNYATRKTKKLEKFKSSN